MPNEYEDDNCPTQDRRSYSEVFNKIEGHGKRLTTLEVRQELFERHMTTELERVYTIVSETKTALGKGIDEIHDSFNRHTEVEDQDRKVLLGRVTGLLITVIGTIAIGLGGWALVTLHEGEKARAAEHAAERERAVEQRRQYEQDRKPKAP